jgi:hypothetical protein
MQQAILQDSLRQRVGTYEPGCERTGNDCQGGVAIAMGLASPKP